jgi:hypothetical protein
MKSKLHAVIGTLALLCVATFWTTTIVSELFLSHESIAVAKKAILSAMWLFVPAMAATGACGFALAKGRTGRLVEAKKRRMKVIGANGVFILVPSAFAVAQHARRPADDRSPATGPRLIGATFASCGAWLRLRAFKTVMAGPGLLN